MLATLNPLEVWALRIDPSDLYNIERVRGDNPAGGGGHTYIQIPHAMVAPTLKFLRARLPSLGQAIILDVKDPGHRQAPANQIEFWRKSDDLNGRPRMRIARQNRHRHARLPAWSPAAQFPILGAGQKTADARTLLRQIGGLRIWLARDANGDVWSGFTRGRPSAADSALPYAHVAWGNGPGGYWP